MGRTTLTGEMGKKGQKNEAPWHDVLMHTSTTEPMDASLQFCPNLTCTARGNIDEGYIRIPCRQQKRDRCRTCGQTLSARRGTMREGLRKPTELMVIVSRSWPMVVPFRRSFMPMGEMNEPLPVGVIVREPIANWYIMPS